MSGKLEKTLHSVVGCPTTEETQHVAFNATTASGLLEENEIYRFAATEGCYLNLFKYGSDDVVSNLTGSYLPPDQVEFFSTTGREDGFSVVQSTTSGILTITKMKTR